MNKAQGCSAGGRERFPLAASIPRHPLGDINFPTPGYSWLADGQTTAQRGEAPPMLQERQQELWVPGAGWKPNLGVLGGSIPSRPPERGRAGVLRVLLCSSVSQDRTQWSLFPSQALGAPACAPAEPWDPTPVQPPGAAPIRNRAADFCQTPAHPGCDVLRWRQARAPRISCTP